MQTENKKNREPRETILNSEVRDSGAKLIFSDNTLCAQFLKDYVDIPLLKEVKPEDIEDVSDQFVHMFEEERNADRVKKVNIRSNIPFFLISLIEHKTEVDYNVSMQVFRYMVFIWDAYGKEMEKQTRGISKRKDFKYPPILPIVYYEGRKNWTAPVDFRSRILNSELFGKYIPDFSYYLVPLQDYSNEELLEHGDEISLVMMLNKLRSPEDIQAFKEIPPERVSKILRDTPEHQVKLIADILQAFLTKLNVPDGETQELVGKVRKKKMAELFGSMEKMDIQAERRKTQEAEEKAKEAEEKAKEAEEKVKEVEEKVKEVEEKAKKAVEKAEEAVEEGKKAVKKAIKAASEEGIKSLVETCQELGSSKKTAAVKVSEKYILSLKEAEEKVDLYWKK